MYLAMSYNENIYGLMAILYFPSINTIEIFPVYKMELKENKKK